MFICHHLLTRFQLSEVQISGRDRVMPLVVSTNRPKPIINVACRLVSLRLASPFLRGTKQKIPVPPGRSAGAGRSNPNRQTAERYYVCLTCLLIRRRVMPCPYFMQARAMKLGFSFPLSLLPRANYLKKPG